MVAPVRCATPGTEVDCACQPCASASSTIQSASTPPPWPPIAITATQIGRSAVNRIGVGDMSFMSGFRRHTASIREGDAAGFAAALQEADHRAGAARDTKRSNQVGL